MSYEELQQEELEVLTSIYDGDENYKQISPTCFQYKIGTDGDLRSFLLQISWVEKYPNSVPTISLDAFYNKNLIPEVKHQIIARLVEEAEGQIETPMTYTLIEWAKDHAEELTQLQPEIAAESLPPCEEKTKEMTISVKKEKKPQLSKQQKRRLADRVDTKGERPRGWDWVDVVKHLSQIGPRATNEETLS